MDPVQTKATEEKRLQAVKNLELLDTPPEKRFDRITGLAARIFSTPISGFALVDRERVCYKSVYGLQQKEIQRKVSLETVCIDAKEFFSLYDAQVDPRFAENILVSQGPKIKFYAGVAVKTLAGEKVGVFFIADRIARRLSDIETSTLKDLAKWVELEITKCKSKTCQNDPVYAQAQQALSKRNRQLAESQAKNEAMLENIGDGVIGINDGGDIVYVNSQTEKMLKMSETELIGKRMIHAVPLLDEAGKEVPPEKRPIRTALLLKKKVVSSDYFYKRIDGSKFAAAITATPVVLHGQVVGGVNVFRDITKEYEIDRMKTEFISLASHQLRTPLSAMKWFTELLLDEEVGKLSEEQREVATNIYQSNERMIELVNALLNISRIESGRIIIEPKITDLKLLVEEVIGELKPKIEEKKHKLAISVHGNLPKINIDPKLVRHVYMNLLTNAIKYTPDKGEITVIISKSGNEVISQITDNGLGIPESQADKVFSKFFRGQNIVKMVTDGTGLGLYLSKAIVESSGGKIWFESTEGKGSTFWFILPLAGSQQRAGEVSLDY